MSDRMDTVLREAFDDIATSAPVPAGLAQAALGQARRQRVGRASLIGGAAVACAAAIAVAVGTGTVNTAPADVAVAKEGKTIVAFSHLYDRTTSPSSRIEKIPATVSPSAAAKLPKENPSIYSLLLDPATDKYEKMPYTRVRPSPDGSRALVWSQPFKVGVWERRTGKVRWFAEANDYGDTGDWSPDGERILFTITPRTGPPAMVLADPDTMGTTSVELSDRTAGTECIFMELVWTPDGKGVAESVYCKDGGQWQANGIRTYDLAGKLKRSIPATAALAGKTAYSPDGALILLAERDHQKVIVVDAVTGAERSRLPLPLAGSVPTGVGLIGWYDAQHLAVYSVSGEDEDKPQASLLVVDLSGATTSTIPVPYHLGGEKVLGTVRR
jgi:hypothetical protein